MQEIKDLLIVEDGKKGWALNFGTVLDAKSGDNLLKVICDNQRVSHAVAAFAIANQIIHKIRITLSPQAQMPEDLGLGGNHIPYEGSDERGVGTGNE
jgi:hypothetical protein